MSEEEQAIIEKNQQFLFALQEKNKRNPIQMLMNHSARDSKLADEPKLENETEKEYIERLTEEYKKKINDATPPALVRRAITFIEAMASKVFETPASESQRAARLDVCFSCTHFLLSLAHPEQVGHCAACGCGKTKLTSLGEKSKILKSTCPKNLWDVTIDPAAVALPIAPPAE